MLVVISKMIKQIQLFLFCIIFILPTIVSNTSSKYDAEFSTNRRIEQWNTLRLKRQSSIKECSKKEFRCDYNVCINKSLTCNGVLDCANGADEAVEYCRKFQCRKGKFRCKNAACIDRNLICDGYNQCLDQSDEEVGMCRNLTCPPNTFRCDSGSCLNTTRLCNGWCSCPGCKDETAELCSKKVCPQDKFRCDYGGCLDADLLCDGFSHCKNGADENVTLCGNRTCPENRFRCSNGLCIRSHDVCDGHCHCPACEDESVEQCENNKCPTEGRTFRCDYGGCLPPSLVCNGVKNCNDLSDESPDICKKNKVKDQTTCTVPAKVANREYKIECSSGFCERRPGKRTEQLAVIEVKCANGYGIEGKKETLSICIDGQWKPPVPRCEKSCAKLIPVNEELTCSRSGAGATVSCDGLLTAGSMVNVKCKEFYRPPGNKKEGTSLVCNESGLWSDKLHTCEPECGKSFSTGQNLVIYGKAEVAGDSPWHVAIYSNSSMKTPELICGATIISENLIVSAAHCFRDNFGNPNAEVNFEAVVAKITRNYNVQDSKHTKRYKIKKIFYPSSDYLNRNHETHQGDIALLQPTEKIIFNKYVLPACIDWSSVESFTPSHTSTGKLVGWGHDASGNASNVLLGGNLPFMSKSECMKLVNVEFSHSITDDKFCAGSLSGVGARPGDSGGGILFRDVYFNSYTIRGVVSTKDSSNTSIATFTDIGLYVDWIELTQNEILNVE